MQTLPLYVYRSRVIGDRILNLWELNWIVVERSFRPTRRGGGPTHCRPFCSCDLDLDPMAFIFELGPYFL